MVPPDAADGRSEMPFLSWNPAYQTGDVSLDFEHRTLIQRINDIETRAHDSALATFLDDLYEEIEAHFSLEEGIFRDCTCVHCASHRAEHKALLGQLRALRVEQAAAGGGRERLCRWLEAWFARHFQTADSRMHGMTDEQTKGT